MTDASTHPTYADLDEQNRALHRQVGELHLVVARALDGRAGAQRREAAAGRGRAEAEAAVARVRAVAASLEATASELDAHGAPHAVGEAAGLRTAAYRIRTALDGPAVSDG